MPQPPVATTPGISPSASSAFSPGYGGTWGGSCASPPCDSPPRQDSPPPPGVLPIELLSELNGTPPTPICPSPPNKVVLPIL